MVPEGVYHFSGKGGPNFSRECGVQMLISIETYRICDFPGGPGPLYPSGSAHAFDRSTCDIQIFKSTVKPIPKDRVIFSCHCSFSIPGASSDTSKHDEVYDSAIC